MGSWRPSEAAFEALIAPEGSDTDVSRPYPFFLASQLEDEPPTLGDLRDCLARHLRFD